MKILYAAGNRDGSYPQYKRFLQSIKNKNIILKTAGYQRSIKDLDADFTLDALLNFSTDDKGITHNGNHNYYSKQIQVFAPDLIISDLEPFTSILALELDIPIWQVSPLLLYWAIPLDTRKKTGIGAINAFVFVSLNSLEQKYKLITRSSKRYVVSHLCDTAYASNINMNFEWVRPEFELDDTITNNVSSGAAIQTADLFYNQKSYCFDNVDTTDPEALLVSGIDKLYTMEKAMTIDINNNVKFLKDLI